jgi:UDP:flavonoid glycosyltransferase YjiC (YdhE family)
MQKVIEATGYPTIWSLKDDLGGKIKSDIIYSRPWLPQETIMAMPEVRCFITHCGWGSTTEAVINEKPMVCIPGFTDQIDNATLIEEKGMGIKVYSPLLAGGPPEFFEPKISLEKIVAAVSKVVEDDSYIENVRKVKAICQSYKTDDIINDVVSTTLAFGNDYLIDQNFEKASDRTTLKTVRLIILLAIVALCWTYRKAIMSLFS